VCLVLEQLGISLQMFLGGHLNKFATIFKIVLGFSLVCVFLVSVAFIFLLYKMQSFSLRITKVLTEVSENRKYRNMFNSLEDCIFHIKDSHIKFMNNLAASLFQNKSMAEGQESEIDIPCFYLYEDLQCSSENGHQRSSIS